MSNPKRTLPLALGFGAAAIMVIYLLLNVAYLYLVPMPEMAGMIREFLLNCGIGCVVHADPIGQLYRLPVPLSRARVFVREADWDEARQLVDQFFRKS